MPGLPTVTGEFRAVRDPELRFTASGKAVATLTVIASERRKNQQTGQWEDGDKTPFMQVITWEKAAEALAESGIAQGDRVLVTGQLFQREYDKNDGTKGVSVEIKYATVAAIPGGKKGSGATRSTGSTGVSSTANDPWGTAPAGQTPPF